MRNSPADHVTEGQARRAARKAGFTVRKLSRDQFMLIQPDNNAVITQGELTAAEVVTYCGILSAVGY
jgi:hypothetical protein